MGKVHGEEVNRPLYAANYRRRLAKVRLGVAGRVRERNKHLAQAKPPLAHVVLHDRVAAREAMLIAQTVKYPFGRVALLDPARTVRFEDLVN